MKHVLITGATSGIGAALARRLDQAGSQLVLIDRAEEGLAQLADTLERTPQIYQMDVASEADWGKLALSSGLTGAAICAGVSGAGRVTDMSFAEWRTILSTNLDGAFLSLQKTLQHADDKASIIAVASATGQKPAPMTAAYGASKAGLLQLVKTAALETAERGIRVNAIAPGGVKTPMFSGQDFFSGLKDAHGGEAGAWAALAEQTPLGRFAEPEEVAAMIGFLLGPDSAMMTGSLLTCDGGYGL